jgi:preprotein translocase subunit SecF
MAVGFAQWGNDLYTGRRSYNIVGRRKIWYLVAAFLVASSAVLLIRPGLNPGIEFRGGSEFTVTGVSTSNKQIAIDTVGKIAPKEVPRVSSLGSSAIRVQTETLANTEVEALRSALAQAYSVSTDNVASSFVGPSWGQDISSKAIRGIVVFLLLVTVVMAAYFRAWRMAVAALIALGHDLIATVGIYAAIGWEVTPATVIGFLTILGYSIYDTVVVFDKVRENTAGVLSQSRFTYEEQANLAVNQTLVRSINTSVVALLPVGGILFIGTFVLGAGTLRDISLALFVGMIIGAFSSIFLATPLEVTLRLREPAIAAHTAKVLAARAEGGSDSGALVGAPSHAVQLLPGERLGNAAQPRRRKTGQR